MPGQNDHTGTAIIYTFPVKTRIAANRIAEQMRRMKEIESARAVPVASASGWYHEAAMEEDRRA